MQEQARQTLQAKEREIAAQMQVLTRPQPDQGSISFGKRVGDGTAMAVDRLAAVSAHDSLQQMLTQVRAALAAIDEGTYGRCATCGQPIPLARLEARPWALTCIRHG